jgi:hypothetical protein
MQCLLRKMGTGGWIAIASLSTGLAFADATLPDIVGMHVGVSAQEAYSFLKTYDRVAKITVGLMPMPQVSDKPVPHAFLLAEDGTSSAEMIEADLTLPPGKQQVWRVIRLLRFAPGKEMTNQNMMATLREKYGPEHYAIGGRGPSMYWFFDQQGARANGVPAPECARLDGLPRVNDGLFQGRIIPQYTLIQARPTTPIGNRCRELVRVDALLAPVYGNDGLVGELTVSISDFALEARAHDATVAFLAGDAAAQKKRDLEQANKQAKPKL